LLHRRQADRERRDDAPSDVQITVLADAGGQASRSWRGSRIISAARVIVPLAVVATVALLERPPQHDRANVQGGAPAAYSRGIGLDPVATAFRGPLRCLKLTFAASDPTYIRAELNRPSPCSRAYTTTILHQVDGAWRPVLDTASYTCPVKSLPDVVQEELGVCPRTTPPPGPRAK